VFRSSADALRLGRRPHPASQRWQPAGTGTGAAGHRTGKRHGRCHVTGRLSIPARSRPLWLPAPSKRCHFRSPFGWGGGLGLCSPHPAKNNGKICFIPEPVPAVGLFLEEGGSRSAVPGSRGDTCALARVSPTASSRSQTQLEHPKVQSSAPCWMRPCPGTGTRHRSLLPKCSRYLSLI